MPQRKMKRKNNIKSIVKREIENAMKRETELKYFDTQFTGSISNSFTQSNNLTNITQGVGQLQRVGNEVILKSIQGKMHFIVGDTTNLVRVTIVKWHEDSGVCGIPTYQSILQSTVSLPTDILSAYHVENSPSYDILFDRTFVLNTAAANTSKVIKFYVPLKGRNQKISFNDSAITGTGKLYLLFISDSAGIPHPLIDMYFRTRYTDS